MRSRKGQELKNANRITTDAESTFTKREVCRSDTLEMFQRAGYELNGYTETDRSYRATFRNDSEFQIKISRPQEIPVYVGMDDFYDLGITGQDWVAETDADVEEILPLELWTHGYPSRCS